MRLFVPKAQRQKESRALRPFVPKVKTKKTKEPVIPCTGCPHDVRGCKIAPVIPPEVSLVVVSDAPDESAAFVGRPLAGPVEGLVQASLEAVGYDWARVAVLNVARCRAPEDDLGRAAHLTAEKRCRRYLEPDLALEALVSAPLLLLGERAFHRFWKEEGRKPAVGAYRGLWIETKALAPGRKAFVVRHPRDCFTARDPQVKIEEFRADIRRMASSLNTAPLERIVSEVYASPFEAREALARLAARTTPWAFDIESYDAVEFPSRKFVSTDPCHPDFRLRGIAFAWAVNEGMYVDLKDCGMAEARELFAPAFMSDAEKWAFSGHFDEEGVVYTGLTPSVRNRSGDGMLAMVALGDGTHDSLRLEKAVVDVLGRPQYWNGYDKSMMRDAPLVDVADGAIGDACYTFELCTVLHDRIEREDYLLWGN